MEITTEANKDYLDRRARSFSYKYFISPGIISRIHHPHTYQDRYDLAFITYTLYLEKDYRHFATREAATAYRILRGLPQYQQDFSTHPEKEARHNG